MPGQPRLDLVNFPQRVVQCGNDRQPCLLTDADRLRYRQDLRKIALRAGCNVHAYVLMTHHVHLFQRPGLARAAVLGAALRALRQ
jgi:putative transposase